MAVAKRVKNLVISRPIAYGNSALPLEPRDRTRDVPAEHTHKWTVFVRDPAGQGDLSYLIDRVVFKLHETYNQPQRVVKHPPYEVSETGWGEFEVAIRIYFSPAAGEKNVSMYHHIKLHPYGSENDPTGLVRSVIYDELVFSEPTEPMFEILTSKPGALLPAKHSDPAMPFSQKAEHDELDRMAVALEKVKSEIKNMRVKILELEKARTDNAPPKTPA